MVKIVREPDLIQTCVEGGVKGVKRPSGSNRFDERFCVKTVKHTGSIMV